MRATYHNRRSRRGVRVGLAHLPESECVAFSVHLPAGSRHDPPGRAGLAHFAEHMVFKGTATRGARDLSLELEDVGASIDAYTSEEHTVYEARGDAATLPRLIDILGDMIWRSVFPAAEVNLERDVIAEEIVMYDENPADHIGDLLSDSLWSPHPLGNPVAGSMDSIERIDRDALVDFAARHHRRRDLVIAVAGPFGMDEVIEKIDAVMPDALEPPGPSTGVPAPDGPRERVERRDTRQLQLAVGHLCFGRHDVRRHALHLLSMILGEGSSSRLFQQLREERGLCYQVSSEVSLLSDTGSLEIHAGLDPEGRDEALDCIHRTCRDLAEHGPGERELARVKRLAASDNRAGMESTASHASWVGNSLLDYDRITTPADAVARIEAVTADQVRDVARLVFQDANRATAEIRPE